MALAEIVARYGRFDGASFVEIVEQVDTWKANTQAAIDGAGTVVEVKAVIAERLGDLADFLGPAIAWVILQYRAEQEAATATQAGGE